MGDLHASLTALVEKEMATAAAIGARRARGDVRCLSCNLRYDERQQYGCHWEGQSHAYDEADLEAAAALGREVDPLYVSVSVAALQELLADLAPGEPGAIAAAEGWDLVDPDRLIPAAIHALAWELLEQTSDTADRAPSEEVIREARATAETVLARAVRASTEAPHAYGVEVLWNRGGSGERWGMAMEMSDYRQPLARDDAEQLRDQLVEDGHARDAVRLVAIAVAEEGDRG